MFSGIVSAVGRIESVPADFQGTLVIGHPQDWAQLGLGDSVAVNGCCLTVVEREDERVGVEVMPETLRRTNLGGLEPGSSVNLEPALSLGSAVGGHLVSGHIDATGEVSAVRSEANSVWVSLLVPKEVGRYCTPQGSIAVDGCSLTLVSVADCSEGQSLVKVSLIPHTLKSTVAASYAPGSIVNLEADSVAKLVERLLAPHLESILRASAHPVADAGGRSLA
ncbi:MAG: riboflavin synthase [Candidatus Dormiibacterota bacterium]